MKTTAAIKPGIHLGLESMKELLHALGNPQDRLKFVHISGTNGKGSTLAMISAILEEAEYRVGRYISPAVENHLESFQINGKWIEKEVYDDLFAKILQLLPQLTIRPSQFELDTALAFLWFAACNCHIVVMETGMGGTNDATNIIDVPEVSVITSISKDHMAFLGDTIEELTEDESGIMKERGTTVIGKLDSLPAQIIKDKAASLNHTLVEMDVANIEEKPASILFTQCFDFENFTNLQINLLGQHQLENAILAIGAVSVLQNKGWKVKQEHIKAGLAKASWFGRFTIVATDGPIVVVDGAHNEDAIRAMAHTLTTHFSDKSIIGVMGVFKDKDIEAMIKQLPKEIKKIHTFTLPDEQRALTGNVLAQQLKDNDVAAQSQPNLPTALVAAKLDAGQDGVVIAFGSLSFLAQVRELCQK